MGNQRPNSPAMLTTAPPFSVPVQPRAPTPASPQEENVELWDMDNNGMKQRKRERSDEPDE